MFKRIFVITLIISVILTGCTSDDYTNDSTRKPDIPIVDGRFSVGVDEFINILNKDIKKEDLDLIPTDYKVIKHKNRIAYSCMISDTLKISFISYNDEGSAIVRISMSFISQYKNNSTGENYRISKVDGDNAIKYFYIICDNINPRLNAEKVIDMAYGGNESVFDGIAFHFDEPSIDSEEGNEQVYEFEIVSSEKLYKKYKESMFDDNDIFFRVKF